MGKTYRRSRFEEKFGESEYTDERKIGKGKFRDGIEQYHSQSCNNNNSCPHCKRDRLHSSKKRYLIPDDDYNLNNKRRP